jgi:hypothetical protein
MTIAKKRRRQLLIGACVGFGIFLVVGIVLAGLGELPNPPNSAPIVLEGGNVRGNNHMVASRSWSLSYDRGEFSPDGTTGTLDGVHNGIIYRKGKPYVEIAARHIALNTQTLDFTAVGLVHIQMLDDPMQRSFDTDYVAWTNDAKLLRMDHPSFLHVGGQTLKIRTIAIDFDKNEVHLGHIDGAVGIP